MLLFGGGLNTVSESTVSDAGLSESFCPHRVPGRELSEFVSAYDLCAKPSSPSSMQNSSSLPKKCLRALSSETILSKQYSARFLAMVFLGGKGMSVFEGFDACSWLGGLQCKTGKSKRGLSKRGLGPKGAFLRHPMAVKCGGIGADQPRKGPDRSWKNPNQPRKDPVFQGRFPPDGL